MCCFSAGRLLLFTKPVIFIRLHTFTGVFLTGCIGLVLITADHLYRWITCNQDELHEHSLMQIFRSELGLPQYMHKNYTTAYSQLNNSIRHVEDIDNDHQCSDIPFQKIQSACFLLLEVSKLVFILAKEYTKHRPHFTQTASHKIVSHTDCITQDCI